MPSAFIRSQNLITAYNFFQVLSGSYAFMASAIFCVFLPRFFW